MATPHAMKQFECPPLEDCKELVQRLRGKSVAELIELLGKPARKWPASSNTRYYGDRIETVQFRRTLEFRGVSPTIHSLLVFERSDGKFELNFRGKELESHDNVA